jgi:hypothetical protein
MLLTALIFILFEAVTEGLLKRFNKADWLFVNWVQWLTAFALFASWFVLVALPFDNYSVPIWKQVLGFIFVRWLYFDFIYNLFAGNRWDYYGSKKTYDKIMTALGEWGLMMKIICGIIGVCFLLGID